MQKFVTPRTPNQANASHLKMEMSKIQSPYIPKNTAFPILAIWASVKDPTCANTRARVTFVLAARNAARNAKRIVWVSNVTNFSFAFTG